ncbi:LysR family transcriptional regulator [Bifidobacterium magnum]|uniref:LysR-type transcriptional regulator n=1 Tax=Bifidobacterium magnum TaxID=1692 RepID=A0A087BB21_9BIFI|nr:LysR family transcriptional regulator [Bifidobacterium magnum]KFI68221.1 LysR-type transcriptional regulator [Bifidobacterium magnum]
MDLHTLRNFLAVAQEGGISAAADVLRISQPALSRQMRDLEKELDTTLFIRGNRSRMTELTAEGMVFQRRAREIVELADRAYAEMHQGDTIEGTVHIAAAQTVAMRTVGRAAGRVRTRHPGITFDLYDGYGPDNTERLANGLADFAILVQPVDMSRFDYLPLPEHDVAGVLMPEDDPLTRYDAISADMLRNLPLFIAKGSAQRHDFAGWLPADAQSAPNIVGTMNLAYNVSCFVKEGCGYALGLAGLVDASEGSGLAFRPLEPPSYTNLCIAWRSGRTLTAASQAFLDELRNVIAQE